MISAGRTNGASRRAVIAPCATRAAPCNSTGSPSRRWERSTTSGSSTATSPLEVALPRGGEVGVDDRALAGHVGVGRRCGRAHAAPGADRELAGRLGRALDHRRDLVEAHREHVVQHEREPLGRAERAEHDLQRDPNGIRQQSLVLRVGTGVTRVANQRLRNEGIQRLLAARPARPEHVQADPRDDRRQPRVEALDLACVRAPQTQPRLLHGVVGFGQGAEDPVGDRAQPWPLAIERVGELE